MKSALLSLWLLGAAAVLTACEATRPVAAPDAETRSPDTAAAPAARVRAEPAKPVASETARALAQNCFTCHGPNGKSPGAIPSLARLGAQRIASRLRDYKSGAEPSTVMGRHARAYTDAEIEAVASYIAAANKGER